MRTVDFFCTGITGDHIHSNATFSSSLPSRMLTHISMICSNVGIIDPEQLLQWVLSFFFFSVSLGRAWRRLPSVSKLAAAQQNPAEDTSQMKFSSPSQETPSPFVFIILTSLFKELSSSASIRLTLQRSFCAPHSPHLFGAHPEWGAAMCFSHSSLPQKTWGGVEEGMKRGTSSPR